MPRIRIVDEKGILSESRRNSLRKAIELAYGKFALREFAQDLGCTRQRVVDWLRGKDPIPQHRYDQIAHVLITRVRVSLWACKPVVNFMLQQAGLPRRRRRQSMEEYETYKKLNPVEALRQPTKNRRKSPVLPPGPPG